MLDLEATDVVRDTIGRHDMLQQGEPVLVAFSGGPDSTALTVLLAALGYDVVLGHVDHGLRPDSAADVDHCREVAERLKLLLLSRRVRVDPPTQARARRVRYEALEGMAREAGVRRIATGHTSDDQAETVLMRLRRGGFGLGIPAVRQNVVRPLLDLRRSDTARVCREAGLPFLDDPSNRNESFRRVAVRRELAGAEGRIRRLLQVGEEADRDAGVVSARVNRAWSDLVQVGTEVRIARHGLASLDPAVARQLVHRAGAEIGVELSRALVADLVRTLSRRTGASLDLPEGLRGWSEPEWIVLGRRPALPSLGRHELGIGHRTVLPDWKIEVTVAEIDPDLAPDPSPLVEVVDADALGAGLELRQWEPGDRFHPLGAAGSKKLQDYFVDAKVPRHVRRAVPLVVSGGRIVWVVGHRLDDRVKLTSRSRRALRIEVRRLQETEV